MKSALTFLLLSLITTTVWAAGSPSRLIRVHTKDRETINEIALTGADIVASGKNWLDVVEHVHDRKLSKLLAGLRTTVRLTNVHSPFEAYRDKEDLGIYHTMDEIVSEVEAIATEHANIVHMEIIGQTYQGRDIRALKVSDNPQQNENEPAVLLLGSVHSREWIANEVIMATLNHLVSNYGQDEEVTRLVNEREIWIVPVANIDGAHYSQTEFKMWRKSRRDNGDGTFGVDCNRNWGYNWGGPGSSSETVSDTYHGPEPFSEPCVAALRDLCLREHFKASIACHSYSELVLWPWGTTFDKPDDFQVLAHHGKKLAQLMGGYEPKQASGLYACSGISDDWLYGEQGVLCYTFEFGTQFIPEESEVPSINERFVKAALYLIDVAEKPFPLITHNGIDPTTDLVGPYPVTVKFNKKSNQDFPLFSIELLVDTEEGVLTRPTSSEDGENYTGHIAASGYGKKSYRLLVKGSDGSTHIFPTDGSSYTFDVVDSLYLIIDDDKSKAYEVHYKEAFAAIDKPAVIWEVEKLGTPPLSRLLAAEAVVWLCGNDSSTTLLEADQELLRAYLSQGGLLLLFGQDIGYDIKDTTFYKEVLKAKYYLDSAGHEQLQGFGFLAGDTYSIASGGDNVVQYYPEAFFPLEGAQRLLQWIGDDKKTCGALSYENDNCRLAYFGIGLEGVHSAASRNELLRKCLNYLSVPSIAQARRATSLGKLARLGKTTKEKLIARNALDAYWSKLPSLVEEHGLSPTLLQRAKGISPIVRLRFQRAAQRYQK